MPLNSLAYTSDFHNRLCQRLWISLGRPLSPLMMDLHLKVYRFHVLLKVNDACKSDLGETQIGYCLIVCLCLGIRKEN